MHLRVTHQIFFRGAHRVMSGWLFGIDCASSVIVGLNRKRYNQNEILMFKSGDSNTLGANSINPNDQTSQGECWNLESGLDVLIVLLYSEGPTSQIAEPIEGITRLDKIMYLLSQTPEFGKIIDKGYHFEADNFGPFAPELFDDIEALKQENIISVVSKRATKNKIETIDEEYVEKGASDKAADKEVVPSWKSYSVERYELTDEGMKVGAKLYSCLTEKQKTELKRIKRVFAEMNLGALLHYVYTKFPELTGKSKIRDKVLY